MFCVKFVVVTDDAELDKADRYWLIEFVLQMLGENRQQKRKNSSWESLEFQLSCFQHGEHFPPHACILLFRYLWISFHPKLLRANCHPLNSLFSPFSLRHVQRTVASLDTPKLVWFVYLLIPFDLQSYCTHSVDLVSSTPKHRTSKTDEISRLILGTLMLCHLLRICQTPQTVFLTPLKLAACRRMRNDCQPLQWTVHLLKKKHQKRISWIVFLLENFWYNLYLIFQPPITHR